MKLSILMPTLWQRRHFRERIIKELRRQVAEFSLQGQVEIVLYEDGGECIVGKKRQYCLEASKGLYVCNIDDDDMVAPTYLLDVLNAMENGPDVITFEGHMTRNGQEPIHFVIKQDIDKWDFRKGVYYRPPHHLTPVKRSIAMQCRFKEMAHGEDADFGKQIAKHIKTSVHIEKELYFYEWVEKYPINPNSEKAGLKVDKVVREKPNRGNRPQRQRPQRRVITKKR